jgi:hypothetical protein
LSFQEEHFLHRYLPIFLWCTIWKKYAIAYILDTPVALFKDRKKFIIFPGLFLHEKHLLHLEFFRTMHCCIYFLETEKVYTFPGIVSLRGTFFVFTSFFY